ASKVRAIPLAVCCRAGVTAGSRSRAGNPAPSSATQGFALAAGLLRPEPDGARGLCVARWTGCRDRCGGSRRAAQRTHLARVAVAPLALTRPAISLELDDGQGMRSGLGCRQWTRCRLG